MVFQFRQCDARTAEWLDATFQNNRGTLSPDMQNVRRWFSNLNDIQKSQCPVFHYFCNTVKEELGTHFFEIPSSCTTKNTQT